MVKSTFMTSHHFFLNYELLQNCCEAEPPELGLLLCFRITAFGKVVNGISELVPENLRHAWHCTDQFPLEILHHNRMMNYRCRSLEPESATAFYIPFYAGLAVGKYLWYMTICFVEGPFLSIALIEPLLLSQGSFLYQVSTQQNSSTSARRFNPNTHSHQLLVSKRRTFSPDFYPSTK